MKKTFLSVILLVWFGAADTALAVTFGEPDGGEHPYVGVTVFTDDWENFTACSGTLIAPTVFLTAGHCAADAEFAWVSFDEDPGEDFTAWDLTGVGVAHPQFNDFVLPNTNDIGVILLDKPVVMETYGELAPLGYLDRYRNRVGLQETIFEQVGYGVNSYKPRLVWYQKRYKGEQRLINLVNQFTDGYNVMFTNNPGRGSGVGGTCSGDSGGPVFVNNTNTIVAVISFGVAPWCKGNDYDYRVDIENAYDFLEQFVDGLR